MKQDDFKMECCKEEKDDVHGFDPWLMKDTDEQFDYDVMNCLF